MMPGGNSSGAPGTVLFPPESTGGEAWSPSCSRASSNPPSSAVGCLTREPGGPSSRAGPQEPSTYLVQENPAAPLHPTRRSPPQQPSAEARPRHPLLPPSPPALQEEHSSGAGVKGSGEPPPVCPAPQGAAFRGSIPAPEPPQGFVRSQRFAAPCSARALCSHGGPRCLLPICLFS